MLSRNRWRKYESIDPDIPRWWSFRRTAKNGNPLLVLKNKSLSPEIERIAGTRRERIIAQLQQKKRREWERHSCYDEKFGKSLERYFLVVSSIDLTQQLYLTDSFTISKPQNPSIGQVWCSAKMSIDGFWGTQILEESVGHYNSFILRRHLLSPRQNTY